MNSTLMEINEIILLTDKMLDFLQSGHVIQTRNEIYEEYKEQIKAFVKKYKIDEIYPDIYKNLCKYYFTSNAYMVDESEALEIKKLVIQLKKTLLPNVYEKIFISHCEKDKKYTEAMMELLHAIGIPRLTINQKESMIFCSSDPEGYILNGEKNLDKIKSYFTIDENVFFILFYSDTYFESQACLNEQGAVWVMNKRYQEILTPSFSPDKIKGLLDKQSVWFRCDDKYRLNSFKEQLEEMFCLEALTTNAWELARDRFIEQVRDIKKSS